MALKLQLFFHFSVDLQTIQGLLQHLLYSMESVMGSCFVNSYYVAQQKRQLLIPQQLLLLSHP